MNEGAVLIAVTVAHVFVFGALFATLGWRCKNLSTEPTKTILGGAIQGGFFGPVIFFAPRISEQIIPTASFIEDLIASVFIAVALVLMGNGILRRLPLVGPCVRAYADAQSAREADIVRRQIEDGERYRKKYG